MAGNAAPLNSRLNRIAADLHSAARAAF